MSATLTADETAILRTLAGGPQTVRDLLHVLQPLPLGTATAGEMALWTARRADLRDVDEELIERGLIERGRHGHGMRRITQAGREALGVVTAT